MGKLKIGIIGCGNIFNLAHKNALKNIKEVKVVSCMDIKAKRAKEAAKEFNAKAYTTLDEFLSQESDVVEILTPTYTHAELAVKALKSGKHVIVEKPIALTSKEAKKMIDIAEKEDLTLLVGHTRRFDKRWIQIKEVIKKRNIVPMQIRKAEVQRLPFPESAWYWKPNKGGGVAIDLGVHVTDFLRWYFKSEPIEILGIGKAIRKEAQVNNTYDHFLMMIQFEGNKTGLAEVSWAYSYPARYGVFYHHLDILGKNGRIRYTPLDTPVVGVVKHHFEMPRFSPLLSAFPEAFEAELRHFFRVIMGKEEPRITAKDALIALQMAEIAIESAKRGEPLEFKGVRE